MAVEEVAVGPGETLAVDLGRRRGCWVDIERLLRGRQCGSGLGRSKGVVRKATHLIKPEQVAGPDGVPDKEPALGRVVPRFSVGC